MMKVAFVIALFCACVLSEFNYEAEFESFKSLFNKTYEGVNEHTHRFNIFRENFDFIQAHNAAGKSWRMKVTEFADMTHEEFRAMYLGYKQPAVDSVIPRVTINLDGLVTVPDSIDWTKKGAVTDVKNQGRCGSCWAFSTTGSTEGAVAIKTGKLTPLSEQQLVDCSKSEGNLGCNGGLMDRGFEYIKSNGICAESAYPYTARTGWRCKARSCSSVASIEKYVDVESSNEDALKAAVAQQPVSVAIEADQYGFQFYESGVFDGECGTQLDHGVLVAGYGTEDGKDYWLVKNSWGADWGENGYIKLVRTGGQTDGQCGIALSASYPISA